MTSSSNTYEINDQGALMVLVDNVNPTSSLRYYTKRNENDSEKRGAALRVTCALWMRAACIARVYARIYFIRSYSWNEGLTLQTCLFSMDPIKVADVVGNPSATSQSFILYPLYSLNPLCILLILFILFN